jgi:5'-3' exonuclease
MIALIDLDSILYKAVYKVVSISQMRQALDLYGKEGAKQWILEEVYNKGIDRTEKSIVEILLHLEDNMFEEISSTEIYITTCTKSFRKALAPSYKGNRKRNNYVWLLRSHYIINDAKFSDTLEADDLIAIRAKELGKANCIVVSPDKDLKTIGGFYWSYYKQKDKDFDGNYILDENGYHEQSFKQKEPIYLTDDDASFLFWQQMIMGDTSDNIKGLRRWGKVKSEKLLKASTCYWFTVARKYIELNQKEDWKINYSLLKLGSINN